MTHSHTAYIPIWYTPENAAKYKNTAESVSRQINIDKIAPLPRLSLVVLQEDEYGEYELELLSKAEAYGLSVPYTNPYTCKTVSFDDLEYLVCLYENLDEEGWELTEFARSYHMSIQEYHLKDIMKLRFEIDDYEKLLNTASNLHIDWDTSTYDLQGLIEAIAEATEASQENHNNYVLTINAVYRAGREA